MKKENIIQQLTFQFAIEIIVLNKVLKEKGEWVLANQLLRCATSVGANVEESTAAVSKRDFINKMAIASKEARETRYWLRLIMEAKLIEIDIEPYLMKLNHIIHILTKIVKTSQHHLK